MTGENTLWAISGIVTGLLASNFIPRYLGKKAENLATKEDISEITKKIETVRHDYASQLEATKADLSAQLKTHGFRYEKEYEVLSELTALLVDLKDASLNLRPAADFKDPTKSQEVIKNERLKGLSEAGRALYLYREKKRPFYPSEIYKAISAVDEIARTELIQFQFHDPEIKSYSKYWQEADKNHEQIATLAEDAMKKIRERVTKWESL